MQTDAMIPIRYSDYVQLVAWTGRAVRSDKAGAIPSHLDHILDRTTAITHEIVAGFAFQRIQAVPVPEALPLLLSALGLLGWRSRKV